MSSDPLTWLFGLEQFGIKFGLDSIAAIVAALGHPERSFATVHVAGTNGKGSVTAMVDTALRAAGHRSARYTSPHLIDLTERFVIDGRPIRREALAAVVADVRTVIDRLRDGGLIRAQPTFLKSAPRSPSSSSAGLPWRSRSARLASGAGWMRRT
jgi:dihydrofolate synthase/folylpolyglutamate synthase